ncbi:hypothetical protein F383_00216 [Gossypium arboreum]|uniref:Uncharacterized protein n=1 Tax=Gossypium arboreum TaxID=29729 RepID=A0A0B0PQY6_GOSAR|nr:hypothetical protein F383_00216 [Gossypium arboreum]
MTVEPSVSAKYFTLSVSHHHPRARRVSPPSVSSVKIGLDQRRSCKQATKEQDARSQGSPLAPTTQTVHPGRSE